MRTCRFAAVPLIFLVSFGVAGTAAGQQSSSTSGTPAAPSTPAAQSPAPSGADRRSEIYYDVAMGHLFEQEYATSSRGEDANQAIDFYKKAYALDPSSPVIGEQLAEMYFLAQRIRDAVTEAQQILRRNPDDLATRRLLARVYLRSLGDLSNSANQASTIALAVEQLREIVRLDPSDNESALWLARLYRLSNQNDQAEQLLRGLIGRDPENEEATGQLTQLLIDEGKSDQAVALLQQFLERAPSASLYDQLGDAYGQIHDLSHAEEAYRHAMELEPDQVSHLQHLAQALFDQSKYQDALSAYQKLVGIEPDDANNYLQLSEIYRQLHQLDKAEQQILLAKQHAPGSLEVIYNEAAIYEAEERYDDAIRVLSDAVTDVKGQPEATPSRRRTLAILYQLLGQLYRDEQNYTPAINTFEEMARLGPDEDRRARALIIDTYRADRDLPHAMETARKGLVDYPNDRSLRISQALLYGENNQPDQAAQELRPMLDNSAGDKEIYLDLAQVYQEDQRFTDAEQALRSAQMFIEQPSDTEMISFMLGGVYERAKKYDEAEQAFKSVVAADPHYAPALNYYGYMLADRGTRLDEAVALVQRALAEDPTNPAYLDSLGWAYYKQNKLADAETYLRKAVDRDAHDPTLLSHLGDVLAKSGQTDLAAAEWEKSLAEWHRALPADFDANKAAELEQKISSVKRPVAQQKPAAAAKPH